jgi:hypothetical protein
MSASDDKTREASKDTGEAPKKKLRTMDLEHFLSHIYSRQGAASSSQAAPGDAASSSQSAPVGAASSSQSPGESSASSSEAIETVKGVLFVDSDISDPFDLHIPLKAIDSSGDGASSLASQGEPELENLLQISPRVKIVMGEMEKMFKTFGNLDCSDPFNHLAFEQEKDIIMKHLQEVVEELEDIKI